VAADQPPVSTQRSDVDRFCPRSKAGVHHARFSAPVRPLGPAHAGRVVMPTVEAPSGAFAQAVIGGSATTAVGIEGLAAASLSFVQSTQQQVHLAVVFPFWVVCIRLAANALAGVHEPGHVYLSRRLPYSWTASARRGHPKPEPILLRRLNGLAAPGGPDLCRSDCHRLSVAGGVPHFHNLGGLPAADGRLPWLPDRPGNSWPTTPTW
jgi:hypothetical protein